MMSPSPKHDPEQSPASQRSFTNTLLCDIGNVILSFDHMIACRELSKLTGVPHNDIHTLIFDSGLESQFDEGQWDGETFFRQCQHALGVTLEQQLFRHTWSNIFRENVSVTRILRRLRPDTQLIIFSNTNEWHFDFIKRHFPILGQADAYVLSYEVGATKPSQRIFDEALRHAQYSNALLYIDDKDEYVDRARALGIDGFVFRDADSLAEKLATVGFVDSV